MPALTSVYPSLNRTEKMAALILLQVPCPQWRNPGVGLTCLLAQHLHHIRSKERAVVFHEIDGLPRTANDFAILDGKRTTDAAQDALQVGFRIESQAAIVIKVAVVVVIFIFRKYPPEMREDVFLEARDTLRHQQSRRSVASHHIHEPLLYACLADHFFHLRGDVDGLFGLPCLDFDFSA